MINIINGNILEAEENVIVQQVNCMGVMGAGLAKQIRAKYPKVYSEYLNYCNKHAEDRKTLLGTVNTSNVGENRYVMNIFSQFKFGRSGIFTDYDKLEQGFEYVLKVAGEMKLSIAIPYGIGCGLAGGDWTIVFKMIEKVFGDYGVSIYKFV